LKLRELIDCFQGLVPSTIGTVSADGTPNVAYISQVHFVDDRHVALSCQFFNKTRRNLEENPFATAMVVDPGSLQQYWLSLRFTASETAGPLFDDMAARLAAIAAQSGMTDTFKLQSADLFEVLDIELIPGTFARPPAPPEENAKDLTLSQLRGLQALSAQIDLPGFEKHLGLSHTLLLTPQGDKLRLTASHPRLEPFEVALGEGLLGAAARSRKRLRISSLSRELRYVRAVAHPLPGFPEAQSLMVAPLLADGQLAGLLIAASEKEGAFDEGQESAFAIAADLLVHRLPRSAPEKRLRTIKLHREEEALFVDREYLTRGVAALIGWKLLGIHAREGRTEFTNRELRMDPSLKLPDLKDNLESRLALLRKRFEAKCPDIRLVPTGRGKFALEVDCALELSLVE
jgi:adenylate cyclase